MESDTSDPHKVIPISFNSPSILTNDYYTLSNLPSETYRVVTRSQTKMARMQMTNMHRADKALSPKHKPEIQVKREGKPKVIKVVPNSLPQPQRIIPTVIPMKGLERTDGRKIFLDLNHLHYTLYQSL